MPRATSARRNGSASQLNGQTSRPTSIFPQVNMETQNRMGRSFSYEMTMSIFSKFAHAIHVCAASRNCPAVRFRYRGWTIELHSLQRQPMSALEILSLTLMLLQTFLSLRPLSFRLACDCALAPPSVLPRRCRRSTYRAARRTFLPWASPAWRDAGSRRSAGRGTTLGCACTCFRR